MILWTWRYTTFKGIPIFFILLTNKNVSSVHSVTICEEKTMDCAPSGSFQHKLQQRCFYLWSSDVCPLSLTKYVSTNKYEPKISWRKRTLINITIITLSSLGFCIKQMIILLFFTISVYCFQNRKIVVRSTLNAPFAIDLSTGSTPIAAVFRESRVIIRKDWIRATSLGSWR